VIIQIEEGLTRQDMENKEANGGYHVLETQLQTSSLAVSMDHQAIVGLALQARLIQQPPSHQPLEVTH
jgi:hypothetical protein